MASVVATRKPTVPDRNRANRALSLRLAGLRYEEIAERLDYADEAGPRKAIARILDRQQAEGVAELREVEGARLDRLQSAAWTAAIQGDLDAIKTVLAIIDRRAKLFGLNAPVAVALNGELTEASFATELVAVINALRPEDLAEVVRGLPRQQVIDAEVVPAAIALVVPDSDTEATTSPEPERQAAGQSEANTGTEDGWSNIGGLR